MTKQEFLDKLRISLNGKVAANQVEEHIRYYEDYINIEMRKGRSEEEVMASLGDPRLISRTIVETSGMSQSSEYESTGGSYSETDCQKYNRSTEVRSLSNVPGWVWIILVILIVIIILGAVFSVITALMPVVLPILLIVLLVKMFKNR